jgi:Domain of unknown function (DUF5127)/Domain of unknown function (DUF4964)
MSVVRRVIRIAAALTVLSWAAWPQDIVPLRPPAVPLIAHDPYFSVWSAADRLSDTGTTHWTGKPNTLTALARIDNKVYNLTGTGRRGRNANAPAGLEQTRLEVLPTRTIYEFSGAGVKLGLTFLTPALPEDLDVLSRPLTYIEWTITSTDGKEHQAAVYFDAGAELAVNTADQAVSTARFQVDGQPVLRMGSREQAVLAKRGDDLRIDWGYLYLAADRQEGASQAILARRRAIAAFSSAGRLPDSDEVTDDSEGRPSTQVLAIALDLGRVTSHPIFRYQMIAYDDLYSIEYFHRRERAWWRRDGADGAGLVRMGRRDHDKLRERCEAFDQELMADMRRAGLPPGAGCTQTRGGCGRHGPVLPQGELQQRVHRHGGRDLSRRAVCVAVQSAAVARPARTGARLRPNGQVAVSLCAA